MRTRKCGNRDCGNLILYADLVATKYCSNKCRQAAYRQRKKAGMKQPVLKYGYRCVNCGSIGETTKRSQRFCSTSCRVSFHQQMKRFNNSESVKV